MEDSLVGHLDRLAANIVGWLVVVVVLLHRQQIAECGTYLIATRGEPLLF